jgi:AraC-like DNA-binding protein
MGDRGIEVRRSWQYAGYRVSEVRYAGSLDQPAHAHETTRVTLIVAGSLEESVGARSERAQACSVVVKPAGTEHQDRFGDHGACTLSFELESGFIAELEIDHALRRWRWSHCGPPARVLMGTLRAIRADPDRFPRSVDDHVLHLLAVLAEEDGPGSAGSPPPWLESAKLELERRGNEPFRVRDTAALVGVHPVYFTRQFRRHVGCSPTEYLVRRRLQRAADLAASTSESFAGIAHGSGFADQSHLCRTFKAGLGITPTDYRRLARSA